MSTRWWLFLLFPLGLFGSVRPGVDVFYARGWDRVHLEGKRVGLITNVTAVNGELKTTLAQVKERGKRYQLTALFAPEHGYYGDGYAYEKISDLHLDGIPIYSLHGVHRRPTSEMLERVDVLIYDIQDIGSRSYTFVSTLFYCMEEAAKRKIKVIVFDRPNPLGGELIDGPLLNEGKRSFLGYVNVPYCHGMTVGELAHLFNEEYQIQCDLLVVPMEGWRRSMSFDETGLQWVPTSPYIPESDTPFFYPTTGLIGHCSLASIGIGYTLPFKLVGAPWIRGEEFADQLNQLKLPGVTFQPFYYRPFYGKFKLESCAGVRIVITDRRAFLPVTTQYALIGTLKHLYPEKYGEAFGHLLSAKSKRDVFNKLNGNEEILRIITEEPYFIWKLRNRFQKEREEFAARRKKYLLYE